MVVAGTLLEGISDNQLHRFKARNPPPDAYIDEGLWRWSRHPNYLGEMMIYGSFAMMVWHWFPVLVLAWVWCGLFAVNMLLKEASMSRYPEWAAYKQRSWWLIPFVL